MHRWTGLFFIGGAQAFDMSTEDKDKIMKGMMDGNRNLDAWFITGGTKTGIMEYVGEGRAKYNPKAPLIGITILGVISISGGCTSRYSVCTSQECKGVSQQSDPAAWFHEGA